MSKQAIEGQRINGFLVEPENLKIVTEPSHFLYDERVKLPLDENLVLNIMAHGVKQAVLAKKDGDSVLVVDGRQRVRAAIEANKRLKKEGKEPVRVKVLMEKGDEADLFGTLILANELRHDDTPMIKAKKAARLISMGRSEEEAAITYGVSTATIKNWLKLLDASAKVRKAVDDGKITATAAVKLSALSAEEQDEALDEIVSGGGTTVREAEHKVKAKKGKTKGDGRPSIKKVQKLKELMEEELKQIDKKMPAHDELAGIIEVLGWVIDGTKSDIVAEAFRK